MEALQGDIACF